MRRIHLFELHDQSWCPEVIRNEITLLLESFWTVSFLSIPPYCQICGIIEKNLENLKNPIVLDLCSGSGGPILKIVQHINSNRTKSVRFLLTDLYPNQDTILNLSGNTLVSYVKDPIDACKIPKNLYNNSKDVVRTIFGAFHHLNENTAKKVLKDTMENSHGIIIVDLPDRSIISVLSQCLLFYVSWIFYLLYIRPLTITRMINIIIPVIPMILTIDGILSSLRTYSKEDYWRILSEIPGSFEKYSWKISRVPALKSNILRNTRIGNVIDMVLGQIFVLQVLEGKLKET